MGGRGRQREDGEEREGGRGGRGESVCVEHLKITYIVYLHMYMYIHNSYR